MYGRRRRALQLPSSARRRTRLRRTPTAPNSALTYSALARIRAAITSQGVRDTWTSTQTSGITSSWGGGRPGRGVRGQPTSAASRVDDLHAVSHFLSGGFRRRPSGGYVTVRLTSRRQLFKGDLERRRHFNHQPSAPRPRRQWAKRVAILTAVGVANAAPCRRTRPRSARG